MPGAVPDADGASGALLALHKLGVRNEAVSRAVGAGVSWLLDLQNRGGGIPAFCRGWANLPFDRSAPDLTAHALGAMGVWVGEADPEQHTVRAMDRAMDFMKAAQRADGSWTPLWFGSQSAPNQENPVYGTSRVLTHLSRVPPAYHRRMDAACERGARWLLSAQNADGGWGGTPGVVSSIEETSLAVDALAELVGANDDSRVCPYGHTTNFRGAIARGAQWLIEHTDQGGATPACPIGLYFAQLWYFEELYPLVFALSALGKAQAVRRFG